MARRNDLEQRVSEAEARNGTRQPAKAQAKSAGPLTREEREQAELAETEADMEAADGGSRLRDRAADAASRATGFVRRHPLAVAAGVAALGAVVALALPRSKARKAGAKLGRQAHARSVAYGAVLSELALTYGKNFLEAYDDARKAGEEKLEDAGSMARHARTAAMRTVRHAGRSAVRLPGLLRRKLR
jgi:ElaB/YqjD/DUF883 family membrane-anchored ribosome-binding protein